MHYDQDGGLTDAELETFFDRLFPYGFAGADVLEEGRTQTAGNNRHTWRAFTRLSTVCRGKGAGAPQLAKLRRMR